MLINREPRESLYVTTEMIVSHKREDCYFHTHVSADSITGLIKHETLYCFHIIPWFIKYRNNTTKLSSRLA